MTPIDTEQMKVFISSTSEDLKDYRAVARLSVLDVGWFPEMMEHWRDARGDGGSMLQKACGM